MSDHCVFLFVQMDYDYLFRNVQGLTHSDIQSCACQTGRFNRKSERKKALNAIREIHSYGPQSIIESMVEIFLDILKQGCYFEACEVELALRDLRFKDFLLKKLTHEIPLQTDYVDMTRFYFPRSNLMSGLEELLANQQFAFLIAPSGTGKSTLIQLFMKSHTDWRFIPISLSESESTLATFQAIGLNLGKQTLSSDLSDKERTFVFVIDDAQLVYHEELFWYQLLKVSRCGIPENIKFVIAADHQIVKMENNTIDFPNLPMLDRDDFLLDEEESIQFLCSPLGIVNGSSFKTLQKIIASDCGGMIVALRISCYFLNEEYEKYYAEDQQKIELESALIQFFYSSQLLGFMSRCYGDNPKAPSDRDFYLFVLKLVFFPRQVLPLELRKRDFNALDELIKSGVLMQERKPIFSFTSSLAMRFYCNEVIPRFTDSFTGSISEFIVKALSRMSASSLERSSKGEIPVERFFLHLFLDAILSCTPPHCSISPNVSKVIFKEGKKCANESLQVAEVLIGGELRWGIQLIVNDKGIATNPTEFRMANDLGLIDYVSVIFCEGSQDIVDLDRHKIAVIFPGGSFVECTCIIGGRGKEKTVKLSP
jgi:hypothetical protein